MRVGRLCVDGTMQGGFYGVDVNRTVSFDTVTTNYVSNIHIEKLTFNNFFVAVLFKQTNSSSVTDCAFTALPEAAITGILDAASQGGNHYRNDRFDGNQVNQLEVESASEFPFTAGPSVLKDCRYEATANKNSNLELESSNE
jgi:hypothetical protein